MHTVFYEGKKYQAHDNETVLDCLLRNGIEITNSCKSGVCHSCLLKCDSEIEANAQKGLSQDKKERGLFLSCQQKVNRDLEVSSTDTNSLLFDAQIISQHRVSDSVVVVRVATEKDFPFKGGQFVNLIRSDNVCRSYSIASTTGCKDLEFHIRRVPDGKMSTWLYDNNLVGEKLKVSEAIGECYFSDEFINADLLLLGVGTGLAPLYAVLKDRLKKDSDRPVTLYHAGLNRESLYLVEELKILEQEHEQFTYRPVYLKGEKKEGFTQGDFLDVVKDHKLNALESNVLICGDPMLVKKIKQTVFLMGVSSKNILSDPFIMSH